MDEPIYVILKVLFGFALEVWFSIFLEQVFTKTGSPESQSNTLKTSGPTSVW